MRKTTVFKEIIRTSESRAIKYVWYCRFWGKLFNEEFEANNLNKLYPTCNWSELSDHIMGGVARIRPVGKRIFPTAPDSQETSLLFEVESAYPTSLVINSIHVRHI